MTEIPAKPILFSGPMVRAILSGSKTQTRRVLNPQPSAGVRLSPFVASSLEDGHGREIKWKYTVGMRLWVRETFSLEPEGEQGIEGAVAFRADGQEDLFHWKPSIFMPRRVSRITLEVTGVRVERLQSISEEDAIAEGIKRWIPRAMDNDVRPLFGVEYEDRSTTESRTAIDAYRKLWDKLNGKQYPWDSSPWCWVISFRRVE